MALGYRSSSVLPTLGQLRRSDDLFVRTLERLASGSRLNRPSDDAASLSISSNLVAKERVYSQAVRNGNDAVSLLNIAQSTLESVSSVIQRLKELASQSANGVLSLTQRTALHEEAYGLTREANRLIAAASFNGLRILSADASDVSMQLGYGSDGSVRVGGSTNLRRQIGTGSFGAVQSGVINANAGSTVGDFNNDGHLDVIGVSGVSSQVTVGLGNGSGSLSGTPFLASAVTRSVGSGDFDGDGDLDLAVGLSNGKIEIYSNDGNASFSVIGSVTPDVTAISDIQIADINSDGQLDILAGTASKSLLYVATGQGNGSFNAPSSIAISGLLGDIAVGDFNADGIADVGVTNSSNTAVNVLLGSSTGLTDSGITIASAGSIALAAGDVNRDGYDDIVLGDGSIYLWEGGGFTASESVVLSSTNGQIRLSDVNGDGLLDIVKAQASTLDVLFGDGTGSFGAAVKTSLTATVPTSLNVADFNNDGVPDVQLGVVTSAIRLGASEYSTGLAHLDLLSASDARNSLSILESVEARISNSLSSIGASMARLESAMSTLQTTRDGYADARQRISDADIAFETANLTRSSILRDSAAAILAQANLGSQLVLQLLDIQGE